MRRIASSIVAALLLFACVASTANAEVAKLASDLSSSDGRVVESALKKLKDLGPDAAPAVPAIVQLLQSKRNFHEQDYGLDNVVYPAAFVTLKAIGVKSDDVLRVAIDYYENSADFLNAKPLALAVIADFGEKAAPVAPALLRKLEDPKTRPGEQRQILDVLEKIGPRSGAAVPALIHIATTSPIGSDRAKAFSSLVSIAPHDRRVLQSFSDVAWKKPGNSGDMEVSKVFVAYLATYDKYESEDLLLLAAYLTRITERDEKETNHAGHMMDSNIGFLEVAKVFLAYREQSGLIMAALAARIRQLDLQTKDFRATVELAGEFGANAGPLVAPIYERASSRERVTVGYLQPLAIKVLQKIGTPDAVAKADALSSSKR